MFNHLHVHSYYSLGDGTASPKALAEKAKALGQTALAITEHGSLRSCYEFWQACKKQEIKPILGMEAYIVQDTKVHNKDEKQQHIVLLASDAAAWRNLKFLHKKACESFYRHPVIDLESLETFASGLICLTACSSGILSMNTDYAVYTLTRLNNIFGSRLFVELQLLDLEDQHRVNKLAIDLLTKSKLKYLPNDRKALRPVITCDVHYLNPEDAVTHNIHVLQSRKQTIKDLKKGEFCYGTNQLWLKSLSELAQTYKSGPFSYIPIDVFKEAVANTQKISSDMIETYEPFNTKDTYPKFNSVPDNLQFLKAKAVTGLQRKQLHTNPVYVKRIKKELDAIQKTGFVDYFLIVWDVVNYARNNHIGIGVGRGSCAGSLVFHCLDVVTLDPVKYGLSFERFLKPGERPSPPDADLDFASSGCDKIVGYIKERYGRDRVCNIGTYSFLKLRSAIKDISRVLGVDYLEANTATDRIPAKCNSFEDFDKLEVDKVIDARQFLKAHSDVDRYSRALEGVPRHAGVHAAGILITPTATEEWVPAGYVASSETKVSEWDMDVVDELKLLKLDILRLNTIDIIERCVNLIEKK